MGKIVCAIEKCSRTRQSQNSGSPSQRISLFSFPKDDEVLDKWLEFINQHNVNKLTKETLDRKRLRLCHLHFQRKDISHKGNKDRILLRNSVPDRTAKVIKHKPKSAKIQPEPTSGKSSPAPTSLTPNKPPPVASTAPTPSTATASATDEASKPDSAPLYHSINGFVVDLRFASQLEMFRLPNGKLIQVRKQAKKAPAAATAVAEPEVAPPDGEKEQVVEIPKDKVPEVVSKKQEEVPVLTAIPSTKKRSERVAKKGAAPPKMLVPPPPPPESAKPAVPVHYKTYKNRRSQGTVLRIPQVPELVVPPAIPIPMPEAPTPAPVRPPNPMPLTQAQKPRRPVVAPCLTALQSLIYKKHDEITPFDLFQKQFENQLISTAEIALHVVAKINNLINSNPFKTAETEQDLKYMYHHVGYILKYAIDRITGLTETCASDIKNMGFNEKSDLGPVFGAAAQDPEPTPPQAETSTATETPAATPAATLAEPEPKEADDEDCAIVEEQPDMIEIDSDDDEQDQTAEQPTPATVQPKVEPTPRPLQICSDTEDHHNASRSTSSSSSESEASAGDGEHQFIISEIDEPRGVIRQDSETTLKIANVIEQYYGAESEEEEEEQEETAEAGKQAEPMEVDEQDKGVESQEGKESPGEATDTDEEETTELIEIIDGDDEPETDNDPEYSVLECGDGDYYLVTTDGDEV